MEQLLRDLLEEALGLEDIRKRFDRLAAKGSAEHDLLVAELSDELLPGVAGERAEGLSPEQTRAVEELLRVARECMVEYSQVYREAWELEQETLAGARQMTSHADTLRLAIKLARAQERADAPDPDEPKPRPSLMSRLRGEPPPRLRSRSEQMESEYLQLLNELQRKRRKAVDVIATRRDLEKLLTLDTAYRDLIDPAVVEIGPVVRDRVIVPRVRAWLELKERDAERESMAEADMVTEFDRRTVFLVAGGDARAGGALRDLLRSLGLRIVEWEEAEAESGAEVPDSGDVVRAGMRLAQTAVLLAASAEDALVVYAAGVAEAVDRSRTVLVEVGGDKSLSDVFGRRVTTVDGSAPSRHRLAGRLAETGLEVDRRGEDWLRAGDFSGPRAVARTRGFHHVRVYARGRPEAQVELDLDESTVRERYVRPFQAGRPVLADGYRYEPGQIERILIARSPEASGDILERVELENADRGIPVFEPARLRRIVAERSDDVTDLFLTGAPTARDARTVFLVRGRWSEAAEAMQVFLSSLDLRVTGWPQARLGGLEGQHNTDILDRGLSEAHAVVVLMTPDDVVALHPSLARGDDPRDGLHGQPRPNVLFEAGYAWQSHRRHTLFVEFGGELRGLTNLSGVDRVRFDGSPESRTEVADRLRRIGLAVVTDGGDYLRKGKFPDPLPPPDVERLGLGIESELVAGVPLQWVLLAALEQRRSVDVDRTAAQTGRPRTEVVQVLRWLLNQGLAEPADGHSPAQAARNGACRLTSAGLDRLRSETRSAQG